MTALAQVRNFTLCRCLFAFISPSVTALREVEEELGLALKPEQLLFLFTAKSHHVLNGGKYIDNVRSALSSPFLCALFHSLPFYFFLALFSFLSVGTYGCVPSRA